MSKDEQELGENLFVDDDVFAVEDINPEGVKNNLEQKITGLKNQIATTSSKNKAAIKELEEACGAALLLQDRLEEINKIATKEEEENHPIHNVKSDLLKGINTALNNKENLKGFISSARQALDVSNDYYIASANTKFQSLFSSLAEAEKGSAADKARETFRNIYESINKINQKEGTGQSVKRTEKFNKLKDALEKITSIEANANNIGWVSTKANQKALKDLERAFKQMANAKNDNERNIAFKAIANSKDVINLSAKKLGNAAQFSGSITYELVGAIKDMTKYVANALVVNRLVDVYQFAKNKIPTKKKGEKETPEEEMVEFEVNDKSKQEIPEQQKQVEPSKSLAERVAGSITTAARGLKNDIIAAKQQRTESLKNKYQNLDNKTFRERQEKRAEDYKVKKFDKQAGKTYKQKVVDSDNSDKGHGR